MPGSTSGFSRADAADPPWSTLPLPTHARRLHAFGVDVLLPGLVFVFALVLGMLTPLSPVGLVLLVAVGWVYFVGVNVWLMDGQSVGKVIMGLRVHRLRTEVPSRSLNGLAWSVGRHTVGYVVADVVGVGAALVVIDPRRRALHDFAFASVVTEAARHQQLAGSFAERYRSYWNEVADRYDDLRERNRWFFFPWKLLSRALVLAAPWIAKALPAAEGTSATAPAAGEITPLSAKAVAAIWVTTATATGLVGATAVPSPGPAVPDLAGTWELRDVEFHNDGVLLPENFDGARLEFVRSGDSFVLDGPGPMQGTEVLPSVVEVDDVLASNRVTFRGNCIDRSGGIVAADVYSITATWDFIRVEPLGEGDDRLGLELVLVAVMDVDNPDPQRCGERIGYQVNAIAVRLSGGT